MGAFLDLMRWPLTAGLVMSPVHCLFGLHIVRRGVIFIDLAVAQMAALGMAIAVAGGHEPTSMQSYWLALSFALGTAFVISLTRFRLGNVPHEAIIGIIFVLASALGIVVLEKSPHGPEEMRDILGGSIFLVQPGDVQHTAIAYGIILGVALLIWRSATAISLGEGGAPAGWKRVAVDFVFYSLLAFVVASSVKIAGVLVVFTWLVMPPVAAFLWVSKMRTAVWLALPAGVVGTVAGMWISYTYDWQTGPAIVVVLGAIVTVLYLAKLLVPVREA